MAEKPISYAISNDIKTGDEQVFMPVNVTGENNQVTIHQTPGDERGHSEIPRIEHEVQDPIGSFTGREDILKKIIDTIEKIQQDEAMPVLSQTIVINGIGGVGKTETIRKYIHQFKGSYGHTLWIKAETFNEAKNSFKTITKYPGMRPNEFENGLEPLRAAVQEIYDRLCKQRTLIVFDNAEKLGTIPKEEGIYAFLPKAIKTGCERPTIIVTSRLRSWKNAKVIEVEGFHKYESYKLFLNQLEFDDTEENHRFAAEIAFHTEGLPLAIHVVIAIIRRESNKREATEEAKYTMKDFLTELKKSESHSMNSMGQSLSLIDHAPEDLPVPQSLLKVFSISFQKLLQETHGTLAMKILFMMSLLSPDNIPKTLLTFLCGPLVEEELLLSETLLLLQKFGLVTKRSTYYQVHRLIQRVTLHVSSNFPDYSTDLKPDELLECLVLLFQAKLENIEPKSTIIYETLQNGYQLARRVNAQSKITQEFLEVVAEKLEYHGRYGDCLQILKKHQPATLKDELNDPATRTRIRRMARVYKKNGKSKKAVDLYKLVLEHDEVNGQNHPNTLQTKHNLAGVYDYQGKYDEAIKLYEYVLKARENILGENHPSTLTTKHNLAQVLRKQGKLVEAFKLYECVLKAQENLLGENHPHTLTIKHNLAQVFHKQGKHVEAVKLYECVLKAHENILGENHPSTLTTKHNLAAVFHDQGKFVEAIKLYEYVLKARETILGENHPHTLTIKHNLAHVFHKQGKHVEAVKLYECVLKAHENILGENHPSTLTTKHNLAVVFHDQGKCAEAVEMFEYVLKARENVLGLDHPDTLNTKKLLEFICTKKRCCVL